MNGSLIFFVLSGLLLVGLFFGGYFGASNSKKSQQAGEKIFAGSAVMGLVFLFSIHQSWARSGVYIVIAVATYLLGIWMAINYKSHVARTTTAKLQEELDESTERILEETGVV